MSNPTRIIRNYTDETYFHRLLNTLFRSTVEPYEMYYIQPFIMSMFTAIQNHLHSYTDSEKRKFCCCRGTYLEEISKEIKNLITVMLAFKRG